MGGLPRHRSREGTAHADERERLLERHLRMLFDNLPALAAYWDRDLRNVLANDAHTEWFGLSPEQMEGMHIRDVLGEDAYTVALPFITGALAGQRQEFNRTLVDTLKHTRHAQASYVPEIVDGEVQGFFVLVTDVTARVEAERVLDEAQRLGGVASWTWSPDEDLVAWSPLLYELTGEDPRHFRPTPAAYYALIHPEDVDRVRRMQEEAAAAGEDYEARYRILRRDGQIRHVVSRSNAERAPDGTVLRLRGSIMDETVLQEAAAQLTATNAELVQVNRVLTDTMGMLGHDIRTPLSVVLGYLEQMQGGLADTPPEVLEHHIGKTFDAARRMRRLLDDVLSMVNVDSGVLTANPRDLEVDDLLADVIHEFDDGGPVAVSVASDSTPGCRVHADAFHLRQGLVNLITNARRYGLPPVTITAREHEGQVELSVRDAGSGVPEALLPRLFERFSAGENQSESSARSTGFGLYLVRRLVSANGGSVAYAPSPTGGACFTIRLPAPSES